jgi:outer membrane immunogenic protein
MKKIALTMCALAIVAFSFGQERKAISSSLDQSRMQLNLGVGVSTWGLPVYLGVDYWATQELTIGLEASARYNLWSNYAAIGGQVNANYHFNKILDLPENLDFYAGISAGPYFSLSGYWNHIRFGASGQVGGRYKINDKIWLHGELGGGSFSGAKLGITMRR